ISAGVFAQRRDGAYELTGISQALRSDAPVSLRHTDAAGRRSSPSQEVDLGQPASMASSCTGGRLRQYRPPRRGCRGISARRGLDVTTVEGVDEAGLKNCGFREPLVRMASSCGL
ncbi:hypothetical protein, partial [Nocardia niigatensis]